MRSSNYPDPVPTDWLDACQQWAWRNRSTVGPAVAVVVLLAALVGLLIHHFVPTDIERAEADVTRAWAVIPAVEAEANRMQRDAGAYKAQAAEHRKALAGSENSSDVEWVDRTRVMAVECERLSAAADERRDHLVRLSADYRQRVGSAEREILRARTARECGTPYEVAPRVRDLLTPIFTNH